VRDSPSEAANLFWCDEFGVPICLWLRRPSLYTQQDLIWIVYLNVIPHHCSRPIDSFNDKAAASRNAITSITTRVAAKIQDRLVWETGYEKYAKSQHF
jgi:hypothetical protein